MNAPGVASDHSELITGSEVRAAVTLNGVGYNLARAVGPALGGLTVGALDQGLCSYSTPSPFWASWWSSMGGSGRWASIALPAEDAFGAMRSGIRYIRYAPALRAVLSRTAVFIFGGSALWALLPLVARPGTGTQRYGIWRAPRLSGRRRGHWGGSPAPNPAEVIDGSLSGRAPLCYLLSHRDARLLRSF